MQRIKRGGWLVVSAWLTACGGQGESSFCATHGGEHWRHRDQQPALVVDYAARGKLAVQLLLPAEGGAIGSDLAPRDILELPAGCSATALRRDRRDGRVRLRFEADCGDEPPADLSVPLLEGPGGLREMEVTMTTPAVRKHFVIHRDCERALFNVGGEAAGD
ncbi:hypothetical protein [Parahaliea mediterranea]|uniref:hypothetical protein n=1 Tax=Parahaliea mediterranea TaxID=651086 RepID=UPI0013008966|nr:hypothetical protein [Parahaliea mediterranea]